MSFLRSKASPIEKRNQELKDTRNRGRSERIRREEISVETIVNELGESDERIILQGVLHFEEMISITEYYRNIIEIVHKIVMLLNSQVSHELEEKLLYILNIFTNKYYTQFEGKQDIVDDELIKKLLVIINTKDSSYLLFCYSFEIISNIQISFELNYKVINDSVMNYFLEHRNELIGYYDIQKVIHDVITMSIDSIKKYESTSLLLFSEFMKQYWEMFNVINIMSTFTVINTMNEYDVNDINFFQEMIERILLKLPTFHSSLVPSAFNFLYTCLLKMDSKIVIIIIRTLSQSPQVLNFMMISIMSSMWNVSSNSIKFYCVLVGKLNTEILTNVSISGIIITKEEQENMFNQFIELSIEHDCIESFLQLLTKKMIMSSSLLLSFILKSLYIILQVCYFNSISLH